MKCTQCGNEVNPGAVCSVCGKAAPLDDTPTVASEPMISVQVPDTNNGGAMNQPAQGTQMPYQGTTNSYQGAQNPYQGVQPPFANGQTQTSYQGVQPPFAGAQTPYQQATNPPEPKKSKAPFIVAGIILGVAFIAIIILLVLIIGGGDDKDKDKDNEDTEVTTEEVKTEEAADEDTDITEGAASEDAEEATESSLDDGADATTDASDLDGTIVYEDEYVAITLSDPELDDYGEVCATGQVMNKSSQDMYVTTAACSVDGVSVEAYMYADVAAGATEDIYFSLYDDDMAEAAITHIGSLDIYLYGYDNETYDDIFTGTISLSCDIDTGVDPLFDTSTFTTIYEDNYMVIKVSDEILHDSDYGEYYSYLYIESKVDDITSVMMTDTYIDGELISEHGGWEDIAPMSGAYADVYWYEDDLGENPAFDSISMAVDFFNYFSWDDYSETTIEY